MCFFQTFTLQAFGQWELIQNASLALLQFFVKESCNDFGERLWMLGALIILKGFKLLVNLRKSRLNFNNLENCYSKPTETKRTLSVVQRVNFNWNSFDPSFMTSLISSGNYHSFCDTNGLQAPEGYNVIFNQHVKFLDSNRNYFDAMATCNKEGGRLASFRSQTELSALKMLAGKTKNTITHMGN